MYTRFGSSVGLRLIQPEGRLPGSRHSIVRRSRQLGANIEYSIPSQIVGFGT